MPFVSAGQIIASLEYLRDHTHPFLIAILAAARAGVVVGEGDEDTVAFGGTNETALLKEFSSPVGRPDEAPLYNIVLHVVFILIVFDESGQPEIIR